MREVLSEEQIRQNQEQFIQLLSLVQRKGANIEGLIQKLQKADFFTAPASTQYHSSYPGGLCQHSLNVFQNLLDICKLKGLYVEPEGEEDSTSSLLSLESILIVGLLHDISKMNFYTTYERNVKIADPETGKYQWIQQTEYKTRPAEERLLYGSHEQTSDFMVSCFIPLSVDEHVALLHHHGGKGFDSSQVDLSPIYSRNPLAVCLHLADMMSTYVDEGETL